MGDAKNPGGLAGTQRGHEEVGGLTSPTYLNRWHPPGGVRKVLADGSQVMWAIHGHLFMAYREPSHH